MHALFTVLALSATPAAALELTYRNNHDLNQPASLDVTDGLGGFQRIRRGFHRL